MMDRIHISEEARQQMLAAHSAGAMAGEMAKHAQSAAVNLSDPHELKAHLMSAHGWDGNDMWRNSHEERHPQLGHGDDDDRELTHDELRRVHDHHDHVIYRSDFPKAVTVGHSHFHEA